MHDVQLNGVLLCSQEINESVRQVNRVVNADHIETRHLIHASSLSPSFVTSLVNDPLQTTGVPIRELDQFLNAPEGRHGLAIARHDL